MPSSQTPPAGGTALDPTAVRADLGDARVVRVGPGEVRATLEDLRRNGFSMLTDIGGADYPGRTPRFDVVYHLTQLPTQVASVAEVGRPQRVRVLCGVDDGVDVPTVSDLWPSADWAEREVYDLFGVRFAGHPDLRRIQMPDFWTGHPLRKDYPLRGPAAERAPRPSFALKSNVAAGTPASGRTAAALQRQIAEARGQTVPNGAPNAVAATQSGITSGAAVTAGTATASELAQRPENLKTKQPKDAAP